MQNAKFFNEKSLISKFKPVISRPVSSSGPVLSDYRRIISQMVSAGITNVPQTCDYTVPELFWPVLAQDDNLAVKMLLAGVNVEQSMLGKCSRIPLNIKM